MGNLEQQMAKNVILELFERLEMLDLEVEAFKERVWHDIGKNGYKKTFEELSREGVFSVVECMERGGLNANETS